MILVHFRCRCGWLEYRGHNILTTDVIEIQGAQPRKSLAPPSTAQTPQPNWFIFWREAPYRIAFRGTEAILEFHPMGRDMNKNLAIFAQF